MIVPEPSTASQLERAVISKVLVRLVPFLALLYVFNLLDRGNVGIAALTMQKDLKFSNAVYGLGAGIFFIGYFIFEVPSNIIMEKVGARRWIARIMLSWGVVSTSMLFVRTPASFYTLRFLLGLAEAGFYPGILLYLTYWVPGNARAQVIARFLALTSVLGLFGGPLGGLILKLNGMGGLKGWQWLFLLEGLPSILFGFVVLFVLPDSPLKADWLSTEEKDWLSGRLAQEAGNKKRIQHLSFRTALSDPRILHMCLIFFLTAVAGNMVGFFTPKLLAAKSGGAWDNSFVATVGIIPAIVGAISMLFAASHSDRTGRRRRHVTIGYFVAGLGFLACVYMPSAWFTIAALSLYSLGERAAAGSYWALTTNLMGARAAAGGIAFINSVGNLGGFFGPVLMGELLRRTHENYTSGLWVAACLMILGACLAYLLRGQPTSATDAPAEPNVAAAPIPEVIVGG